MSETIGPEENELYNSQAFNETIAGSPLMSAFTDLDIIRDELHEMLYDSVRNPKSKITLNDISAGAASLLHHMLKALKAVNNDPESDVEAKKTLVVDILVDDIKQSITVATMIDDQLVTEETDDDTRRSVENIVESIYEEHYDSSDINTALAEVVGAELQENINLILSTAIEHKESQKKMRVLSALGRHALDMTKIAAGVTAGVIIANALMQR